ncbi:hypothetical protein ACOSQ2_004725 [Xanthoceras sorbifolium]
MVAGQPQSEDELISQVLGGLGAEYDSVVVNITARQEHITLQVVQFLLMSYESRLAQHNALHTIDIANASADYGNNNGMRGNNSQGRSRGRSQGRGRFGNKIICQLCGKGGHMVTSCYCCFDQTFQGIQNNNLIKIFKTKEGSNISSIRLIIASLVTSSVISLVV